MIAASAFQTRARTLDHLGREQIADCPTAISELWKNAYDAYARNVQLDIFDGERPVAVISDDGHGMNSEEFFDRWLVVGTESKATERQDTQSGPQRTEGPRTSRPERYRTFILRQPRARSPPRI